MGGEKTKRLVFVTVGTTSFDALVRAVDSETVQKELLAKGYTHLLIQMGRGSYLPTKSEGDCTLAVDYFTFSTSIADHLKSASLIISHAGMLATPGLCGLFVLCSPIMMEEYY